MPTNGLMSMIELDRRAVRASLDAFATWQPGSDDPGTPCAGWQLGDLVAHMTIQQQGFARAVAGERTERADWAPTRHNDPVGVYRSACDQVVTAFAGLSDPTTPVLLPEVGPDPLPLSTAVGFHLVDNVVHAWDVARSLGARPSLDDDVVEAARTVARDVPDGERRDRPGAAFAHRLPLPDGVSALDETLQLLGRDPRWHPAHA
ncbi:TIGR03086 family metal-binding protein [Jatrophihabitans lederbergiae]|uniref:TIGR03086 family metal-binding protein n=1 Tax=Jatrophihabitans lederbergiae TaxID=3075547 RepID=A0ABU2JGW4_9ACTN|nr:TIGR03086 family metal-binding protein [Jatrophihabitans sp. DSM 44399]MDT0264235.1 TIGR03086 family metal-binding protein [Jatrophihabitans sp. DSM 44399]